MCTVTVIPIGDEDFVLTSNRDEAPSRISLDPEFYIIEGAKLLFPKDEFSGGTWIGVSDQKRVVCVLNGAFERHERKASYRLSRGTVAKDFMVSKNIDSTIKSYNLENIESFTMVIVDWNISLKFYELVWDGKNNHFSELPLKPKIWSSSALYNHEMVQERFLWFENFKSDNKLSSKTLLNFHKTAGQGNSDYGVVMNRGYVRTTSITQVEKDGFMLKMDYENLLNNTSVKKDFDFSEIENG